MTLYAMEFSQGSAAPLPGASPQVPGDANEFISFTGECPTQAPGLGYGDCAINYWNCGTAGTGDGQGSGCTKVTP